MLPENSEHCQLSDNCFARPSGGPQNNILVCVVQAVENLGLNGIEGQNIFTKQTLQFGVTQGADWQRIQVQQV